MYSSAETECRTMMPTDEAPSSCNELQKKMYMFLKGKEPQKTLDIAKGVQKHTCKDVNRDLYQMKALNIVTKKDNHWSINCPNNQGEDGTNTGETVNTQTAVALPVQCTSSLAPRAEAHAANAGLTPKSFSGESEPSAAQQGLEEPSTLTPDQKEILQYLKCNTKPTKAKDIARGLKKQSSKDVNPHLYKLRDMKLLDCDADTKCWTTRSEPDAGSAIERAPVYNQNVNNFYIVDPKFVQIGTNNIVNTLRNEEEAEPLVAEGDESDERVVPESSDSHPNSLDNLDCVSVDLQDNCSLECTGSNKSMKIWSDNDSGISTGEDKSFGTSSELDNVQKAVQRIHRVCNSSSNVQSLLSPAGGLHIFRPQDETPPPKTSTPIKTRNLSKDLDVSSFDTAFESLALEHESFEIEEASGGAVSFQESDPLEPKL